MELLRRPEITYGDLQRTCDLEAVDPQVSEQIEIQAKYSGYIDRQREEIERLRRHENTALAADFDYASVAGLSNEVRLKLSTARPETLAQAARVPGVTPAAISLLLIHLRKRGSLERRMA